MKKSIKSLPLLIFASFLMMATSCSENNDYVESIEESEMISPEDETALLFMIEEEKLARDTYQYLYEKWNLNQFSNIKNSEQTHMNSIETLLKKYDISYTILEVGFFNNPELQSLYNGFKEDGAKSVIDALKIGATIEDLDIKDLESFISKTNNFSIVEVYQNLQCGSRNHLRSFINALDNENTVYSPQFLTNDEFNLIINSDQEKCN